MIQEAFLSERFEQERYMLSIRRLFIDQKLESSAEPNPLERAVQFEMPELLQWTKPARLSPSEEESYNWEIAELRWTEVIFQALRAYYGMLSVPPFEIIDGSTAYDRGALYHWQRQLVTHFKQENYTHIWRLRTGGIHNDGAYFISIYHPRRKVSDWLLWIYGRSLDLRFHPSAEEDADEMVETLFKPMQHFLEEGGFSVLEGLPIEVTYERDHLGLRSTPLSEFFDDVGISAFH